MKTIYLCIGSTGEYSSRDEWYVKAFANEEKCKKFVEDVSAAYRLACPDPSGRYYIDTPENPLDPDMKVDYTGTNYYMASVPFEE
jgi:hypothetical protein